MFGFNPFKSKKEQEVIAPEEPVVTPRAKPAPAETEKAKPVQARKEKLEKVKDKELIVFEMKVEDNRKAILKAIETADKDRILENLKRLSHLSSRAIYKRDIREIMIIDQTILELREMMDKRLSSLKAPDDAVHDLEVTRKFVIIRLSLMPILYMLTTMKEFTESALHVSNDELNTKIRDIERFSLDYEKRVVS
jgi:hypothetical protein